MAFLIKRYVHTKVPIIINLSSNINKNIIICSQDGYIKILKHFNDYELETIKVDTKITNCHCLNSKIYLSNQSNQLLIFDLDSKLIIKTIVQLEKAIYSMESNQNGTILACCCLDNKIYLMDTNTNELISFVTYQNSIYNICIEPNDKFIITADIESINIWNLDLNNKKIDLAKQLTIKAEITNFKRNIHNVIWHQNGFMFAVSTKTCINFYERQSWQMKFKLNLSNFSNFIQFSPNGLFLLAASDFNISIFNIISLKHEFEICDQFNVNSIVWFENRILFSDINGSFSMIKLNLVSEASLKLWDQLSNQDLLALLEIN